MVDELLMPEPLENNGEDILDAVESGVEQPLETVFGGIENVQEYVTGHPYYNQMQKMFEDTFDLQEPEQPTQEAPQSETKLAQNGQKPEPGDDGGFDPMAG